MRITRRILFRRYRQIASILARHGLGYLLVDIGLGRYLPFHRGWLGHMRQAQPYSRADHLRLALEELGPTFIKLGQILSTRADLLPPDWVEELSKLQDTAPPVPWPNIKAKLERELGQSLSTAFVRIDPQPLAAASIGQVHRAALPGGEEVVIKIQRPGVYRQVQLDLAVLRALAVAAARNPAFTGYDPPGLIEEFAHTLLAELDYGREKRNLERYARDLEQEKDVRAPQVYAAFSGREVLTMEYLDGVRLADLPALNGADTKKAELAKRMARLLFRSALERGFFHADPHPGNFRVSEDGSLIIFDFGMMGYLSLGERDRLLELLLAVVEADAERSLDRLMDLGLRIEDGQTIAFKAELGRLLYDYIDLPLGEMPIGEILARVLETIRKYRLSLPSHLSMLAKTILMAEGVGSQLDPEFQLAVLVRPMIQRAILHRFRSEQLERQWRDSLTDTMFLLEKAPRALRRFVTRLEQSETELQNYRQNQRVLAELRRLANSLRLSVLSAALILSLALLMLIYHPPAWQRWAGWLFTGGLLFTLAFIGYLLWDGWRSRGRE